MSDTTSRLVLERQLEAAFRRLPAVFAMFPVVALCVWIPFYGHVPTVRLVAWTALIVVSALLQFHAGRVFLRSTTRNVERWAVIRTAFAVFNGGVWGGVLGTLFLLPGNPLLTNFVVFVIGGISVVALASTSTHRPSLFGYEVANNAPLVLHLLLLGGTEHLAMAGLTCGFSFAVLVIGNEMGRGAARLIRAELSNGQLLAELSKTQEELRQSNATLVQRVEQRTRALELALAEKEVQQRQLRQAERMEAIGRLAGGVAHDFNNILTGISGFASLVRDSLEPNDERRVDLDEILEATDRAGILTKQLLGFAKGGITRPQHFDLCEHLGRLENTIRRILPSNVGLNWVLADEPLHLYLDPEQVEQLIMNLVVNARDSLTNGGTIRVQVAKEDSARADPGHAIIRVVDNGPGIPDEAIEHIFEPSMSTKGESGSNIGLATCFGIAQRAGGSIRASSQLGRGATFDVVLPLSPFPSGIRSARQSSSPVRSGAGIRVLLVEDQEPLLKLASRSLRHAGFIVDGARSAEEALSLVEQGRCNPDVVVSDVVLPLMSGVDPLLQLRGRGCGAKFLLVSGYIDDANLRRKDLGESVELLAKPYTVGELMRAVQCVLDSGTQGDV